MLMLQDCFLSHTYDRLPANPDLLGRIPDDIPQGAGSSYAKSVLKLTKLTVERTRDEVMRPDETISIDSMLTHRRGYQAILEEAQPFLVDKGKCRTLQEHLERAALNIHVGYVDCRTYRLCLERDNTTVDQALRDSLAAEYLASATNVVQSFLDMHRLLPSISRMWSFVHNVASSAIPLKTLKSVSGAVLEGLVGQFEPLVQRLIWVLDDEAKKCEWYDADTNVRQYGPCSRVARALRETYGNI